MIKDIIKRVRQGTTTAADADYLENLSLIERLMAIEVSNDVDAQTLRDTVDFIDKIAEYADKERKCMAHLGYVPASEVMRDV